MTTTSQRMRAWRGPALLTYGFRPFFFGAGVWAIVSMLLWLGMLNGGVAPPIALDPVSWHAHEFLFGYLGAVTAGFLLTAVPNWTGRLPIVGWPLGGLFALWILGRGVVLFSAGMPPLVVALVDLAFPAVLTATIAWEIIQGRNWKNLLVLGMLVVFATGNAVFHWEAARGDYAAQGLGLRIGLGAGIMMIAVIGGRIVPSFTRNWLVQRGGTVLPAPPMGGFDKVALLILLIALLVWVARPQVAVTGGLMIVAAMAHFVRLARWAGHRTGAEALVWSLHAGYLFLPLGALALGLGTVFQTGLGVAAAQHLWMAGAIGLMTLAVMTRATLGHSGQALTSGSGTIALYLLLILSVLARVCAGVIPEQAAWLHMIAGFGWLGAFGVFIVIYGPLHMARKGQA
ncbi:MAG: short-chain dehydrogenase [Rhodospirillaceae bacterium]|nr:short-chain dehydrogenase [Rhodospirillaceae bacterium]